MDLKKKNIKHLMNGSKKKLSNAIFLEYYRLNGAVIDAIEYFLYMKSIGIDIKLCVFNRFNKIYSPSIEEIHNLIEDRYDLNFDYKDDIIFYSRTWDFIKVKYNTVLIMDRATSEVFSLLNAKKVIFFHDYSVKKDTDKLYKKMSTFDHVKIYHEMSFAITSEYSQQTNLKMAFSLYKEVKESDKCYFMNMLSKGNEDIIKNFVKETKDNVIITTTDKSLKNIRSSSVNIYDKHPKDFFSLFNTYVYVHDGLYFDPRPRMFHECAFYGKNIKYINEHNIKDGSWYRYNEILNASDAIEKRTLTSDDTIIREFYD